MTELATAPASRTSGRIEVAVGGMSCAACATRIEKKLNKLPGAHAVVNFATERAIVTGLAPDELPTVVSTVEAAGYRATRVSDEPTDERDVRLRGLRRRILVAALLTLPLSNLTIALALVPSLRFPLWEWLCVLIATPVVGWAAWPFHRATLRNLRHRVVSMDILVSLGVGAAYLWSVVSLLLGSPARAGYWLGWGVTPAGADALYLEVAAAVTTFLLIGRYFETRARGAAGDVLGALRALAPTDARVRRDDGRDVTVPIAALSIGDRVVVRPGETIPADGTITDGHASVDTSSMTGEPLPRDLTTGDPVLAGTIDLDGVLTLEVNRIGVDTQLEQMADLAEEAQARKARVQRLVDRVVGVFVPAVLIIAALTLTGWLVSGAPVRSAFSAALSVLIIACPCALGLATPTALMVGVGRAAQLGIVVKGPVAFEASGEIDTVVLDKTGTLTTGTLRLAAVTSLADGWTTDRLSGWAARLERDSEHPVGRALAAPDLDAPDLDHPDPDDARRPEVSEVEIHSGRGIRAEADGRVVVIGSRAWAEDLGLAGLDAGSGSGQAAGQGAEPETFGSSVYLGVDGQAVGRFDLVDTLKDSAVEAVAALRAAGLRTVLLTGDAAGPARTVGDALGVDAVIAEVLPTQKAATLEQLQAEGHTVAMVGDGINDAAALATADLGLAVLNGTDLALRSADVILVRPHLGVIADAVALARRTLRTIRGNLIWAFGYNVAAIPLAAAGWLNPLVAGFAMSFSSLFVVGNSLRLRHFEPAGRARTDR